MMRATTTEQLDYMLMEWHDWAASYRPKLGAPRMSSYCAQSVSSRQWEDSTEASCGRLHTVRMSSIDFCVSSIPSGYQRAIGIEMRNRASGTRVWRNPTGETYASALLILSPIASRAGLLD